VASTRSGGLAGRVDVVRLEVLVHGRVQGVGFRAWTRALARDLGLRGSARNLPDGRVAIVAEGPRENCRALLDAIRGPHSPGGVSEVVHSWSAPEDEPLGFRVG
jgi:acylphosphatase